MTRSYTQRARAEAQEARRQQVLDAAMALWHAQGVDSVTLQAIADAAGVALKTVVRNFGTKEGLVTAAMERAISREEQERDVPVGAIDAVVATLAGRYEALADWTVRNAELEFRFPVMERWVGRMRTSHAAWLARVFAPWLPPDGPVRTRRLMALFWATEIRCWWAVRVAFDLPHDDARDVMREGLRALVEAWEREDGAAPD